MVNLPKNRNFAVIAALKLTDDDTNEPKQSDDPNQTTQPSSSIITSPKLPLKQPHPHQSSSPWKRWKLVISSVSRNMRSCLLMSSAKTYMTDTNDSTNDGIDADGTLNVSPLEYINQKDADPRILLSSSSSTSTDQINTTLTTYDISTLKTLLNKSHSIANNNLIKNTYFNPLLSTLTSPETPHASVISSLDLLDSSIDFITTNGNVTLDFVNDVKALCVIPLDGLHLLNELPLISLISDYDDDDDDDDDDMPAWMRGYEYPIDFSVGMPMNTTFLSHDDSSMRMVTDHNHEDDDNDNGIDDDDDSDNEEQSDEYDLHPNSSEYEYENNENNENSGSAIVTPRSSTTAVQTTLKKRSPPSPKKSPKYKPTSPVQLFKRSNDNDASLAIPRLVINGKHSIPSLNLNTALSYQASAMAMHSSSSNNNNSSNNMTANTYSSSKLTTPSTLTSSSRLNATPRSTRYVYPSSARMTSAANGNNNGSGNGNGKSTSTLDNWVSDLGVGRSYTAHTPTLGLNSNSNLSTPRMLPLTSRASSNSISINSNNNKKPVLSILSSRLSFNNNNNNNNSSLSPLPLSSRHTYTNNNSENTTPTPSQTQAQTHTPSGILSSRSSRRHNSTSFSNFNIYNFNLGHSYDTAISPNESGANSVINTARGKTTSSLNNVNNVGYSSQRTHRNTNPNASVGVGLGEMRVSKSAQKATPPTTTSTSNMNSKSNGLRVKIPPVKIQDLYMSTDVDIGVNGNAATKVGKTGAPLVTGRGLSYRSNTPHTPHTPHSGKVGIGVGMNVNMKTLDSNRSYSHAGNLNHNFNLTVGGSGRGSSRKQQPFGLGPMTEVLGNLGKRLGVRSVAEFAWVLESTSSASTDINADVENESVDHNGSGDGGGVVMNIHECIQEYKNRADNCSGSGGGSDTLKSSLTSSLSRRYFNGGVRKYLASTSKSSKSKAKMKSKFEVQEKIEALGNKHGMILSDDVEFRKVFRGLFEFVINSDSDSNSEPEESTPALDLLSMSMSMSSLLNSKPPNTTTKSNQLIEYITKTLPSFSHKESNIFTLQRHRQFQFQNATESTQLRLRLHCRVSWVEEVVCIHVYRVIYCSLLSHLLHHHLLPDSTSIVDDVNVNVNNDFDLDAVVVIKDVMQIMCMLNDMGALDFNRLHLANYEYDYDNNEYNDDDDNDERIDSYNDNNDGNGNDGDGDGDNDNDGGSKTKQSKTNNALHWSTRSAGNQLIQCITICFTSRLKMTSKAKSSSHSASAELNECNECLEALWLPDNGVSLLGFCEGVLGFNSFFYYNYNNNDHDIDDDDDDDAANESENGNNGSENENEDSAVDEVINVVNCLISVITCCRMCIHNNTYKCDDSNTAPLDDYNDVDDDEDDEDDENKTNNNTKNIDNTLPHIILTAISDLVLRVASDSLQLPFSLHKHNKRSNHDMSMNRTSMIRIVDYYKLKLRCCLFGVTFIERFDGFNYVDVDVDVDVDVEGEDDDKKEEDYDDKKINIKEYKVSLDSNHTHTHSHSHGSGSVNSNIPSTWTKVSLDAHAMTCYTSILKICKKLRTSSHPPTATSQSTSTSPKQSNQSNNKKYKDDDSNEIYAELLCLIKLCSNDNDDMFPSVINECHMSKFIAREVEGCYFKLIGCNGKEKSEVGFGNYDNDKDKDEDKRLEVVDVVVDGLNIKKEDVVTVTKAVTETVNVNAIKSEHDKSNEVVYAVGDRVDGKFEINGRERWFVGVLLSSTFISDANATATDNTNANTNANAYANKKTHEVLFDDGDYKQHLQPHEIRVSKNRKAVPGESLKVLEEGRDGGRFRLFREDDDGGGGGGGGGGSVDMRLGRVLEGSGNASVNENTNDGIPSTSKSQQNLDTLDPDSSFDSNDLKVRSDSNENENESYDDSESGIFLDIPTVLPLSASRFKSFSSFSEVSLPLLLSGIGKDDDDVVGGGGVGEGGTDGNVGEDGESVNGRTKSLSMSLSLPRLPVRTSLQLMGVSDDVASDLLSARQQQQEQCGSNSNVIGKPQTQAQSQSQDQKQSMNTTTPSTFHILSLKCRAAAIAFLLRSLTHGGNSNTISSSSSTFNFNTNHSNIDNNKWNYKPLNALSNILTSLPQAESSPYEVIVEIRKCLHPMKAGERRLLKLLCPVVFDTTSMLLGVGVGDDDEDGEDGKEVDIDVHMSTAKIIGSGAFGVVKMCKWKNTNSSSSSSDGGGGKTDDSNSEYAAVKIIPRIGRQDITVTLESLYAEVSALEVCKLKCNGNGDESTTMKTTKSKSGIIQLITYGINLTNFYIITAYHSHSTLSSYRTNLNVNSNINPNTHTPKFFMNIWKEVCVCVSICHAHGVVHHDLKCDNILIRSYGDMDTGVGWKLVLCDFGEAEVKGFSCNGSVDNDSANESPPPLPLQGEGEVRARGTERIQSPEMLVIVAHSKQTSDNFDRRKVDNLPGFRSDTWSLGCLLYELITGEYLFDTGDNWAGFFMLLKDEKFGPLPTKERLEVLGVGEGIGDVVRVLKSCLQRSQERRPTAVELVRSASGCGGVVAEEEE